MGIQTVTASPGPLRKAAGIHHHAFDQLFDAFLVAHDYLEPGHPDGELYAPTVVIGGLALELYLKALDANHRGKHLRTHDLNSLWSELPEADRRAIDELSAPSVYKMADGRSVELIPSLGPPGSQLVSRYPKLFVEWRYYWEVEDPSAINPHDLSMVLEWLQHLVDSRLPAGP